MFSVVIPLYNKELSIKSTLESVLNQSYHDFEVIVVNDGSTDNSAKIVEQIEDERIRLIHQENQGVSAARNKGIEEAKYDWIVFLDGDDLWENNHLEEFVKMIKLFPEDRVFCTSHTKSKLKKEYEKKIINGYEVIEDYFDVVMKHVDFFWTGAVCIHKTVFKLQISFPVGISRGEDLYVWAKIGKKFRIIRSLKGTAIYSFDSENKLSESKYLFSNSILSIISLKGLKGGEKKYYHKIVYDKFKRVVKSQDSNSIFKVIRKHNYRLIHYILFKKTY